MIRSHSLVWADFKTAWYKHWAKELRQDKKHLENYELFANKFWQNAIMVQALWERGALKKGARGLGFGVGQERLPALFAKLGVDIAATDQDFTTQKAGHWSKQELATGTQSLNQLEICDPNIFNERVEYMPADMKKIPRSLNDKYDFLWSNCALGHLGSIPTGLGFIEKSLRCLKPGGWAVHTTELNLLSNNETVTGGSTVVFRLKDIYMLQRKLIEQGYTVSPFVLRIGRDPKDRRISLRPKFGNDYSKIQIMGHLATQIVLIVHRPNTPPSRYKTLGQKLAVRRSYIRNVATMRRYKASDPTIQQILTAGRAPVDNIVVKPLQDVLRVSIPRGKAKEVLIEYENKSTVPLFSTHSRLGGNKPIALGTVNQFDRKSKFADSSWSSANDNRPSLDLWAKVKGKYELPDYIDPGQNFAFKATLNAKRLAKGEYIEDFGVVQEAAGWVGDSTVQIKVRVT